MCLEHTRGLITEEDNARFGDPIVIFPTNAAADGQNSKKLQQLFTINGERTCRFDAVVIIEILARFGSVGCNICFV